MEAIGTVIECIFGQSAQRRVLVGFAPAHVLHTLSFADVLDEDTGRGYQRRFNSQHSLDFRRYIQREHSSTIPLTFNLRPQFANQWRIVELTGRRARLEIVRDAGKILAQVDCQHRLGHLADLTVELPFMCFVGLSEREEMEVFNVINSKAKGLSTSLLDFHDAQLAADLAADRPELFVALFLKNDPRSPWYRQIDLGGTSTSGMTRRASLRTLQKAIKRFLIRTKIEKSKAAPDIALMVLNFWAAVAIALPQQWAQPRFNSWCVGEIHIISKKILPNGRRDDFEVNGHLQNLQGHLAKHAKDLVKVCRDKSVIRNRLKSAALLAEMVSQSIALMEKSQFSDLKHHLSAYSDRLLGQLEELARSDQLTTVERTVIQERARAFSARLRRATGLQRRGRDAFSRITPVRRKAFEAAIDAVLSTSLPISVRADLAQKILRRATAK